MTNKNVLSSLNEMSACLMAILTDNKSVYCESLLFESFYGRIRNLQLFIYLL